MASIKSLIFLKAHSHANPTLGAHRSIVMTFGISRPVTAIPCAVDMSGQFFDVPSVGSAHQNYVF